MMSDVQAADDATTYVTRVIQQMANLQNSSLTLETVVLRVPVWRCR